MNKKYDKYMSIVTLQNIKKLKKPWCKGDNYKTLQTEYKIQNFPPFLLINGSTYYIV